MTSILLAHETRGDQDLVFAYDLDRRLVWAMDQASREEWWYVSEGVETLRPQIAVALLGSGPDLAQRAPGYELLALIESLQPGGPGAEPSDDIQGWCVGFVGEEAVAARLGEGPVGWHVLHSVPVGEKGADLDHVLIGPPGVITLNSKHHPGVKVDVNGDAIFLGRSPQPYVRNSRFEASRTRQLIAEGQLATPVTSAICVAGARLRIKQMPDDVHVVDLDGLVPWLLSLPPVLHLDQVEEVFGVLRRPQVWTSSALTEEPAPWVAEFARGVASEALQAKAERHSKRLPKSSDSADGESRIRATAWRTMIGKIGAAVVVALLVGGLLRFTLPVAVPLITGWISDAVTSPVSKSVTHKAGKPCPVAGKKSADGRGRDLVCRKSPGKHPGKAKRTWVVVR